MYQIGLSKIKDLIIGGRFIKFQEIKTMFPQCQLTLMQFNSLMSAIPQRWKRCLVSEIENEEASQIQHLAVKPKWTQYTYSQLNVSEDYIHRIAQMWSSKLETQVTDEDLTRSFNNIGHTTNIVKYRSFQYRLLNNIIFLNDRLKHLALSETNLCCQCHKEKETVLHLFFECEETQTLWLDLKRYCFQRYEVIFEITKRKRYI